MLSLFRSLMPRTVVQALAFSACLLTSLLASAGYADGPPTLADGVLQQEVRVEAESPASAQSLYRALGADAGVEVDFDPKFRDFHVEWSSSSQGSSAQSFGESLDELGRLTASFWVATGPRTIFVANDTPQARRTYEPMVVASFPLRHAALGDMMTAMRSIYGIKHILADETRNVLTVRDTADRVALARELVARHDIRPPETKVKLELVALDSGGDGAVSGTVKGTGEVLLAADASIVGQGEAGVRVKQSPFDDSTWLDLGVSLETRTEGGEVLLDLSVEAAVLRRETGNSQASTRGTWRSDDGQAFLVQLPLSLETPRGQSPLALRVTPTVVDQGEPAVAREQWVGTETALRAPDTAP